MRVTLFGKGVTGNALYECIKKNMKVSIYDPDKGFNSIDTSSSVVFICVPANNIYKDGEVVGQDSSLIEDCIHRSPNVPIFVRSTILPDTYKKLADKFSDKNIIPMPEFLTARNSVEDMDKMPIIIGSQCQFIVSDCYKMFPNHELYFCNPESACLGKYFHNCLAAVNVHMANIFSSICSETTAYYSQVKEITRLTGHFKDTYFDVPGPDGQLGWGGTCFPKDMEAMASSVKGKRFKSLNKILEENKKIRPNVDKEIPGKL